MKIAVERLSWKEIFDKTEQNRKIGYDVMYCEDIEILKNDYKRYTMEYFVDIFFESGEFCFELNAEKYHLTSPTALVFQPDSEFRFVSCDNPVTLIRFGTGRHQTVLKVFCLDLEGGDDIIVGYSENFDNVEDIADDSVCVFNAAKGFPRDIEDIRDG